MGLVLPKAPKHPSPDSQTWAPRSRDCPAPPSRSPGAGDSLSATLGAARKESHPGKETEGQSPGRRRSGLSPGAHPAHTSAGQLGACHMLCAVGMRSRV